MTGYSSLFNVFRVQVFLIFVMSFFSGKAAIFAVGDSSDAPVDHHDANGDASWLGWGSADQR